MRLLENATPQAFFATYLFFPHLLLRRSKWLVQPLAEFYFCECVQSERYDKIGESSSLIGILKRNLARCHTACCLKSVLESRMIFLIFSFGSLLVA